MLRNPLYMLALLCLAVLFGCGGPAKKGADKEAITVFVAASTKDAVTEIAATFTEEQGYPVKISADDSSKLALQITKDAPAHLFLSANEKWADFVKEYGFSESTAILLGNRLVIVVPEGNPAKVETPRDLTGELVKKVAVAGASVPAGLYAREALRNLAIWDALEKEGKVAIGDNVRVTLAYVERGEAEAGIVYATDFLISKQVEKVHEFDPALHAPIQYPLVLLKAGATHPGAKAFFDYLQSPNAAEAFKKHGFAVLGGR